MGGVRRPSRPPSSVEAIPPAPLFLFTPALMHISSLVLRAGRLRNSAIKSIFMIELVGMFGVSFSKPPCMKMVESIAQIVCLNLCKQSNLCHSLDSVS